MIIALHCLYCLPQYLLLYDSSFSLWYCCCILFLKLPIMLIHSFAFESLVSVKFSSFSFFIMFPQNLTSNFQIILNNFCVVCGLKTFVCLQYSQHPFLQPYFCHFKCFLQSQLNCPAFIRLDISQQSSNVVSKDIVQFLDNWLRFL